MPQRRVEARQHAGRAGERDSLRRRGAQHRLGLVQADRAMRASGDASTHRASTCAASCASAASSTIRSPAAAACSSATCCEIGEALRDAIDLRAGDRIASLVSLTLTPLHIEAVERVDVATGRDLDSRQGDALRKRAVGASLPDDIDESVALAVLDVAGAPAQVRRLCAPGQTVRRHRRRRQERRARLRASQGARRSERPRDRHRSLAQTAAGALLLEHGFVDDLIVADARDAARRQRAVARPHRSSPTSTINCVNVPGTELGSILCTKDGGTVYFFSMSTSFTAAALGAEGVGKDVTMIVGNGYTKGHAETALQTLRDHPELHAYFNADATQAQPSRNQQTMSETHRTSSRPCPPTQFEYKQLKQGEFWRHIPAYRTIDEATFLDHLWQQKNSVKTAEELLETIKDVCSPRVLRRRGGGLRARADGGARFALRDRADRLERSGQRSDSPPVRSARVRVASRPSAADARLAARAGRLAGSGPRAPLRRQGALSAAQHLPGLLPLLHAQLRDRPRHRERRKVALAKTPKQWEDAFQYIANGPSSKTSSSPAATRTSCRPRTSS